MNLVDILARELKAWPYSKTAFVSQDGDRDLAAYANGDQSLGDNSNCWNGNSFISGSLISISHLADDWRSSIITHDQWQAAVDALKVESAPSWVGIGLPPVGIDVEVLFDSLPIKYVGCKILAHDEDRAVYRFTTGPRKGEYGSDLAHFIDGSRIDMFRPIRTPEQIALDVARYQWLVSIEASYGKEAADKCESILIEADNRKQADK